MGLGIEILASRSKLDIESILLDLDVDYDVNGRTANFKQIKNVAAIEDATPKQREPTTAKPPSRRQAVARFTTNQVASPATRLYNQSGRPASPTYSYVS